MLITSSEAMNWVMSENRSYLGGCHCDSMQIEYSSSVHPCDTEVRECQCSFCRKHGTKAIADPAGMLVIRIVEIENVSRYAFGMQTAHYLICRKCGVYVAAISIDKVEPRGIAILNSLNENSLFTSPPVPADYSTESRFYRQARRRQKWTPARIDVSRG